MGTGDRGTRLQYAFGFIRPNKEGVYRDLDFKQRYFDSWSTAWAFHKKWAGNSGTEKEWGQIVAEAERIYEANKDDLFIRSLIREVISELERVDRAKRKEEVTV